MSLLVRKFRSGRKDALVPKETNMNKYYRSGLFTLFLLGGFYAYRNRAKIQEFLESKGIKTPLDTSGKLTDTIRSGIAKLSGSTQHAANEVEEQGRRAI
jgi:hypothetical protein